MVVIKDFKRRYRENTLYDFYLVPLSFNSISPYLCHTKIKYISIDTILCYSFEKKHSKVLLQNGISIEKYI